MSYRDRKDAENARQREESRSSRDIGPLPKCKDKRRRARAEKSLRACCEIYFKDRFPLPWSDDHVEQLEAIEAVVRDGGLQAIAAPRGDGKTTRLEIGIFWAVVVIAAHRFAALLTATGKHAPKRMASLKTALLTNDLLLADFPEVCYPIREMAGISNRCQGQLLDDKPTWPGGLESPWGKKRIIIPTVQGSGCSAHVIEASGLLEAVRGLNCSMPDGTVARPTLALIDDPQTNRSARSPIQSEEREQAIASGIIHLPGPDATISAMLSCTVIVAGDMADLMLSREKHPEWHGIRKKMLDSFPNEKAMPLWDQYATIYRDAMGEGDAIAKAATAFYRRNREAMDAGARVTWKHRKDKNELSALEHAMRLFIRGRDSFFSEMQNEPEERESEGAVRILTAPEVAGRVNGYEQGEIPEPARRLTWFVDVQKELLYWAVCAWGDGFTGWVVDYGTWPEQPSFYFDRQHLRKPISKAPGITAATLEGKMRQALDALFAELAGRSWVRDGIDMHLDIGLVDANWGELTTTVYEACREAAKKFGLRVVPSHGIPYGPAKCPISRYERKKNKGAVLGDEWMMPPAHKCRGVRHVVFDAGRRKSFLWRRLTTPVGDPGSLTLFNAKPSRHRLLSEHVTAERGTQVSGPWGEMTVWTLIPGRENEWLDILSGCCTAESMCGGRLPAAPLSAPQAAGGPSTQKTASAAAGKAAGTGTRKTASRPGSDGNLVGTQKTAAIPRGKTVASPRRSARQKVRYL